MAHEGQKYEPATQDWSKKLSVRASFQDEPSHPPEVKNTVICAKDSECRYNVAKLLSNERNNNLGANAGYQKQVDEFHATMRFLENSTIWTNGDGQFPGHSEECFGAQQQSRLKQVSQGKCYQGYGRGGRGGSFYRWVGCGRRQGRYRELSRR